MTCISILSYVIQLDKNLYFGGNTSKPLFWYSLTKKLITYFGSIYILSICFGERQGLLVIFSVKILKLRHFPVPKDPCSKLSSYHSYIQYLGTLCEIPVAAVHFGSMCGLRCSRYWKSDGKYTWLVTYPCQWYNCQGVLNMVIISFERYIWMSYNPLQYFSK